MTQPAATVTGRPTRGARLLAPLDHVAEHAWVSHAVVAASAGLTLASLVRDHESATGLSRLMLIATLALAVGLALAWRRAVQGLAPALGRREVLALSAVLLLVAVGGPVKRSRDVWSYTMYGREVSVHHVSPYTHLPADFPADPFLGRVAPVWRHTGSVYGPLFTGYSAISTLLAGDSPLANRLAFQGLAGLSVFISLLVLARRQVEPAAIACVGLHPLVIVYAVGGGHNDALVGLGVLVGVLLCAGRRAAWAGVVLALAALVKIVAGLAVLALIVWLWSSRDESRRRSIAPLALSSVAVVVLGYLAAGGPSALGPLSKASHNVGWASFWAPAHRVLAGTGLAPEVSTFAVASVLVVAGILMYRHRHDDGPELIVMGSLLAYQLCSAYVLVWYLLWVLPLGVMRWRTLTGQVLLAYATIILFASSYHADPHERLEDILFKSGGLLHVGSFVLALALVVAAVVRRPRPVAAA